MFNLVNSYEIETINGRKSIEIHTGDITSFYKPFDVLILSSSSYHYQPKKGTILSALFNKNINIEHLAHHPSFDLRKNLNIWMSNKLKNSKCNFNRVICVEFDKNHTLTHSLESLVPILSLAEKSGVSVNTIAMPLLGTGALNLPVEDILSLQLKQCEKILENIESIDKIYLVELNKSKAAKLDASLNKYLNRNEIQIKDIFLDFYNKEVLVKLEENIKVLLKLKNSNNNNDVNYEVLYDFYGQIKRKSLRYFELCSSARKIIEVLLEEQLDDCNKGKLLHNAIDAYLKQGKTSTWIISYMHVVRVLTNNQIHYSTSDKIPNEVKNQDQRILLACLCQITDYWIEISK